MRLLSRPPFLLVVLSLFLVTGAPASEFRPDHELALKILHSGEPDFSEGVAREFPPEESQLQIRRIGLRHDGMLIRAAFRDKTRRVPSTRKFRVRYLDTYYNEVAAYVVARALNLNLVPPTILRSIGISTTGLKPSGKMREGSLQLWVEDAAVEYDLRAGKLKYPGDPELKNLQLSEIHVFDCIIGNTDRHAGNILIELRPRVLLAQGPESAPALSGKLWAIDQSRAFHGSTRLSDGHCKLDRLSFRPVSLRFLEGLRDWDSVRIESALTDAGLSAKQIDSLELQALEKRRRKVLERLLEMQRESGLDETEFFSSGYWHDVR